MAFSGEKRIEEEEVGGEGGRWRRRERWDRGMASPAVG